jgi:release factor glutamine methyltransferase
LSSKRLAETSVRDALDSALIALTAAGVESPRLDAEVLLAHVVGRGRAWLLAHPEADLSRTIATAFEAAIERRATGEPVAYIRGFKEWHSLRIRTDARGLIPRPETELLADAAIDEIEEHLEGRREDPLVAWEVGTGSGAVAVVLARRFATEARRGALRLIATDVSAEALELAAENLAEHGVDDVVERADADLLEPVGTALPRPHVVVANLPYVASEEVGARRGSLGFEPRLAVDGGPDGLTVLRALFDGLPRAAAPGATVLLETGVGQAGTLAELAAEIGASTSVVPDLAGLDRVVRVALP